MFAVLVGCTTQNAIRQTGESVFTQEGRFSREESRDVMWHDMTKDSDLYKAPSPPPDTSDEQRKEYLHGHERGWQDSGDDMRIGIVPGASRFKFAGVPASMIISDRSEFFQAGFYAGARQANIDLETFCAALQSQLCKVNSKAFPRKERLEDGFHPIWVDKNGAIKVTGELSAPEDVPQHLEKISWPKNKEIWLLCWPQTSDAVLTAIADAVSKAGYSGVRVERK